MPLFELKYIGPERGDCTAPHSVKLLSDNVTVEQFINEILINRNFEWGYIGIKQDNQHSLFGDPHIEFFHGKLVDENRNKLEDKDNKLIPLYSKTIKSASADGGWSRMDYLLELN